MGGGLASHAIQLRSKSKRLIGRLRKESVTPWDAGRVQPPLQELLESARLDLPKSGRALVPGCGKACRFGSIIPIIRTSN